MVKIQSLTGGWVLMAPRAQPVLPVGRGAGSRLGAGLFVGEEAAAPGAWETRQQAGTCVQGSAPRNVICERKENCCK